MENPKVAVMRFLPGTLSISTETDIPLLRKVHQAGHATVRQLYRSLMPQFDKNQWDSFNRRTRILAGHGFLVRQPAVALDSHVVSLGEAGEDHLRSRSRTMVEAISRSSRNGKRDQLMHDVELFELHLALMQSGIVTGWQFESEIRADNDFTTYGYAKDYDAVMTIQRGQQSIKIALEYERTPKTSREYGRIVATVNRETRVAGVIYLVCNLHMESFLAHALRGASYPMYIARANSFAADPQNAILLDARLRRQFRLADAF
jgi:hypothetical protein